MANRRAENYEPSDSRFTITNIRKLFLDAIRDRELHDREGATPKRGRICRVIADLHGEPLSLIHKGDCRNQITLRRSVEIWAEKWHIKTDWIVTHAMNLLPLWSLYPHDFKTNVELWPVLSDGWSLKLEDLRPAEGWPIWHIDNEPNPDPYVAGIVNSAQITIEQHPILGTP